MLLRCCLIHITITGPYETFLWRGGTRGRGGWVKMSVTMTGRGQKIKKKHWLKCPKAVPPKDEIWTKIKKIQNLIFGILFLKIVLRAYNVFIFVRTFKGTFVFNVRISSRKSKNLQKLARKITHFTIQFR